MYSVKEMGSIVDEVVPPSVEPLQGTSRKKDHKNCCAIRKLRLSIPLFSSKDAVIHTTKILSALVLGINHHSEEEVGTEETIRKKVKEKKEHCRACHRVTIDRRSPLVRFPEAEKIPAIIFRAYILTKVQPRSIWRGKIIKLVFWRPREIII